MEAETQVLCQVDRIMDEDTEEVWTCCILLVRVSSESVIADAASDSVPAHLPRVCQQGFVLGWLWSPPAHLF